MKQLIARLRESHAKEYLLGLLDGSHSISHEGIGLVLDRLEKLEAVAEAARRAVEFDYAYAEMDVLKDALAALEEKK